jgi:hypothetical protein
MQKRDTVQFQLITNLPLQRLWLAQVDLLRGFLFPLVEHISMGYSMAAVMAELRAIVSCTLTVMNTASHVS